MKQTGIRLLTADEIECRVGTINEKGLSLLLYKDARADMKILDEVYGAMNWQRIHTLIGDNLYCNVQIYDEKKQQWISKMDVGTESYTEKEKGQASDSFKRACVSVGIGRELYTAPFIWVSSSKCNIQKKDNKFVTYDKFKVKEIAYNENREIIELTILNQDGAIVYSLKAKGASVPKEGLTEETKPTVLTKQQIKELNKELDRTGVILDTVLQRYGIQNTTQMTPEIFKSAMNGLKKSKSKEKSA